MRYVSGLSLIVGMFFNSLNATTLIKQSLEEIVNRADLVITGTVVSVENRLETSNNDIEFEEEVPFHYITISVDTVLRNTLDEIPEEIVIRQIGGTIDGKTLNIDGLPHFSEDQELVLSLKESSNGYFYVVGAVQGKYDLDGRGNAIPDTTNSMLVRKGNTGRIEVVSAETKEIKFSDIVKTVNKINNRYAQN